MKIILCADDYGQNTAISQAIIKLLQENRLSATSCMTNSPNWLAHAKWLRPFANQAALGLHFNLTEGKLLSDNLKKTSLAKLILKAYLGQLDSVAIALELNRQIDEFISGIGRAPDFLDGHQHIQQLPIIRDVFLDVYKKRFRGTSCYIRSVKNKKIFWRFTESGYFKTLIIQLCGAFPFHKLLVKHNIPHNTSFSGFYNFSDSKKYAHLFSQFLSQVEDNGIIMCHPGLQGDSVDDRIAQSRIIEFTFFCSKPFQQILISQDITLSEINPYG